MRPFRLSLILIACAFGLTAFGEDKAFNNKVHAYLLNHPEVLQEVEAKLQANEQAKAEAGTRLLIEHNRDAIERDPSDYVANPGGKVTVTEFYDYRCPHCANMAPTVLALIHDNPNVRFVFKEFPIFGADSEKAAAGAMMVKKNGGDYLGLYHDLMAHKGLDGAAIDQILTAHGVNLAALAKPDVANETTSHLSAVKDLAATLGINGTPYFIIGQTFIPGEDPEGLKAAVASALKK